MNRVTPKIILLLLTAFILNGCGGFAKGVTEAVLERKTEDTKKCEITGKAYGGVRQSLFSQGQVGSTKITKVIMVHGISKHSPGYSTRFREKLVTELGLNVVSSDYKEILIRRKGFLEKNNELEKLGVIRVTRHSNHEKTQEMLFYELTWSEITDPDKAKLAFDDSGEYSFKRANANRVMKIFFNDTIPDMMAYRGNSRDAINHSVSQASCWAFSGGWQDLPSDGAHFCDMTKNDFSKTILEDDYFFVTHSLGSRIVIDTLSLPAIWSKQMEGSDENIQHFLEVLKQKEFTVYMLANQLPLLQLGTNEPSVIGKSKKYCSITAPEHDKRIFTKLNMIAFSDPNDILSYPIPPRYADKNIDSRLCSQIVNVNINVTEVEDVFGLEFANPLLAHTGYEKDDRVVALIADGLERNRMNKLISEKCRWIETID